MKLIPVVNKPKALFNSIEKKVSKRVGASRIYYTLLTNARKNYLNHLHCEMEQLNDLKLIYSTMKSSMLIIKYN